MIRHGNKDGADKNDDKLSTLLHLQQHIHTLALPDLSTLLVHTPDDYMAINRLKECESSPAISEDVLCSSVKGYSGWYYRTYVMRKHYNEHNVDVIGRDRLLIKQLLINDGRNFHCWKYLLSFNALSEHVDACLARDIFNYSALHHCRTGSGMDWWDGLCMCENEGMYYKYKDVGTLKIRVRKVCGCVGKDGYYVLSFVFKDVFFGKIHVNDLVVDVSGEIYKEVTVHTDRVRVVVENENVRYTINDVDTCGMPSGTADNVIAAENENVRHTKNDVDTCGTFNGTAENVMAAENENVRHTKNDVDTCGMPNGTADNVMADIDTLIGHIRRNGHGILDNDMMKNKYLLIALVEKMRYGKEMLIDRLVSMDGIREKYYREMDWWEIHENDMVKESM